MYHTFNEIKNVHLLDNGRVTIDGQKFVGSTLWTDFENENPISMSNVSKGLNDYYHIRGHYGNKLTHEETFNEHKDSIKFLKHNVDKDTIVLTHHAPILNVSNPQFKNSPIRGGFESDLSGLIFELQPKYWLYGHTHYNRGLVEFENTKILSNQCGYIHEVVDESRFGYTGGKAYDPKMILEV